MYECLQKQKEKSRLESTFEGWRSKTQDVHVEVLGLSIVWDPQDIILGLSIYFTSFSATGAKALLSLLL